MDDREHSQRADEEFAEEDEVNVKGHNRRRVFFRRLFILLVLALLVSAALLLLLNTLLTVNVVEVEGNQAYAAERLIEASQITVGQRLYGFHAAEVSNKLCAAFPLIRAVQVQRRLDGTVTLNIQESAPLYATELYGEYYSVAEDLTVLEQIDASSVAEKVKLRFPAVAEAVTGKAVVFYDPDMTEYMRAVMDAISASALNGRISLIDASDRYNLYLVCDHQYKLILGDRKDLEIKLRLADAVLNDSLLALGNKAIVDLSNTGTTSVIIDNQVDLD